jgi:cell division septation protein DedD
MKSMLDDDDDHSERTDRELTLSTGMILGIFLGLVLLCGLFFGFGYKMGSHKTPLPVSASSEDSASPTTATFGGFKPSAGSPAGGNSESSAAPATSTSDTSDGVAGSDENAPAASAAPPAGHTTTPVVTSPEPPVSAGSFVVQVAAVSHEEDAQLLVNALRAKGYPVSAHTEPQDKFFHIQVGPFASMQDANTAKQKLAADGYQPIIK